MPTYSSQLLSNHHLTHWLIHVLSTLDVVRRRRRSRAEPSQFTPRQPGSDGQSEGEGRAGATLLSLGGTDGVESVKGDHVHSVVLTLRVMDVLGQRERERKIGSVSEGSMAVTIVLLQLFVGKGSDSWPGLLWSKI